MIKSQIVRAGAAGCAIGPTDTEANCYAATENSQSGWVGLWPSPLQNLGPFAAGSTRWPDVFCTIA